jgi:hypothetical protein
MLVYADVDRRMLTLAAGLLCGIPTLAYAASAHTKNACLECPQIKVSLQRPEIQVSLKYIPLGC